MVAGDVVNTAARLQSVAPRGRSRGRRSRRYSATPRRLRLRAARAGEREGEEPSRSRLWRAYRCPCAASAPSVAASADRRWSAASWRSRCCTGRSSVPFAQRLGAACDDRRRAGGGQEPARLRSSSPTSTSTAISSPGVQGRCLPYGEGITFWALGEVVKAQARHSGVGLPPPRGADAKLSAIVPAGLDRDLATRTTAAAHRPGVSTHATKRDESFTAWRLFLEGSGSVDHPAVVVIEDLHWADEAMLAFLEHVATDATRGPLFVLATARPELPGAAS